MKADLRRKLIVAQDSLWFVPALMVAAAVVVAQGALWLDHATQTSAWTGADWATLGPEGSRSLLVAIAGSIFTGATTAFSITMSVIATASSTYGPRLVHNFMKDRQNQYVLGLMLATFVYALLVLRAVRSANEQAGRAALVPYLGVYLALVLAIVNVGAVVFFVHHVADSIQVPTLVHSTSQDLAQVAQMEYPSELLDHAALPGTHRPPTTAVPATASGYLVGVDHGELIDLAQSNDDGLIQLTRCVGDFVLDGETIAMCRGEIDPREVSSHVTIGDVRTPRQDIRFAIQQLVEMAVRALSPGTNDPYTASNAIDELSAGMTVIARGAPDPGGRADDEGVVRLVVPRPSPLALVDQAFDDLRHHGRSEPHVIAACIDMARRIRETGNRELGARAALHVEHLLAGYAASGASAFDLERMQLLAASELPDLRREADLPPHRETATP